MKLIKIAMFACATLACTVPVFADDVSNAFMPEKGPAIRMQGTLEGDEIRCKETPSQDCQQIFEDVVRLFDGDDVTVDGYVKRKNKRRKNTTFKLVTKRQSGGYTRMICEVDASTGAIGMFWGDPLERP